MFLLSAGGMAPAAPLSRHLADPAGRLPHPSDRIRHLAAGRNCHHRRCRAGQPAAGRGAGRLLPLFRPHGLRAEPGEKVSHGSHHRQHCAAPDGSRRQSHLPAAGSHSLGGRRRRPVSALYHIQPGKLLPAGRIPSFFRHFPAAHAGDGHPDDCRILAAFPPG